MGKSKTHNFVVQMDVTDHLITKLLIQLKAVTWLLIEHSSAYYLLCVAESSEDLVITIFGQ